MLYGVGRMNHFLNFKADSPTIPNSDKKESERIPADPSPEQSQEVWKLVEKIEQIPGVRVKK